MKCLSSRTGTIIFFMSYGRRGFSGITASNSGVGAVRGVVGGPERSGGTIIVRNERKELAHLLQGQLFRRKVKMTDARHPAVNLSAAQAFRIYFFARDLLDYLRPGDEHIAGLFRHENEVSDSRGIDCSTGAGPHDNRNLRDHAGGPDIAVEDPRRSPPSSRRLPEFGPHLSR